MADCDNSFNKRSEDRNQTVKDFIAKRAHLLNRSQIAMLQSLSENNLIELKHFWSKVDLQEGVTRRPNKAVFSIGADMELMIMF